MDAMTPLTVTLPMLDVDWETLVSVNLPTLLFVIVGVPLALVGYIVGLDVLVRRLPKRSQPSVRPWVWVAPAIFFVGLILVYPMVGTVVRSFFDRRGDAFVGLGNFVRLLTDHGVLIVLRNNLLWLLLYPGLVLLFGLLLAVLSDRVKFEKPVKSLIFMPMAISFVAMAIIWQFVYYYKDPSEPQTGILNAVVVNIFHALPIARILARPMYAELYSAGNYANASALAVILLLAVVPVLIFNLRQFRAVEARR